MNAGVSVLNELGLEIPIIGLAKKFEEIFVPNQKDPIILPKNSPLLKIFQRIRDEAHRFAVRLHKKQRTKRMMGSILDDIKGVGPATRNKLLKHFNSVEGVKSASLRELSLIVPETRKTTVRAPFASIAARRLPSPSSLRFVTSITLPPRPPVVYFPNPSAPGNAGILTVF